MPSSAIRVDALWKEYSIGGRERATQTFREMIWGTLSRALRRRDVSGEQVSQFRALTDVSFELQAGEVLGIIGRNGAGKSTLLKILSRITDPTRGEVQIRGRVSSLLEVGTGFHPELTGRENVFLNGAILGMSRKEITRKFDEIVDYADVAQFLDTPVKQYSSGMYMRLAFSVAAHLEPDVVLIDEVLAVGDVAFQKKCLAKMGDVARSGRTVVFVSHQLASVLSLCTTTMVLDKGHLRHFGPTQSVVNTYLAEMDSSVLPHSIQRPDWAEPLITSAQASSYGVGKSDFELGGEIEFEMTVALPPGRVIQDPVMGVVVRHPLFGVVGGVNTRMAGYKVSEPMSSRFVLSCRIANLPLVQGSYSADLWLGDGGLDLDVANDVVKFNIHGTDVYGTGKLPIQGLGIALLRADWGCRRLSD